MPRYTEEQITRANETDLVSFLRVRGEKLKKSGKEYRWMKHDSLTVDHNEWYRFSGSKGGHPIDFLMEFYNMSFPEAVKTLINALPIEPFNVFYQTAEDGVGDTIKPRLAKCGADMTRVRFINEEEKQLSMTDARKDLEDQLIYGWYQSRKTISLKKDS